MNRKALIVVNFKNYLYGKDVLDMAIKLDRISKKNKDVEIIVCAAATDIHYVFAQTELEVFAQHVNNKEGPEHTGYVMPKSVKYVGGEGTLLNHSEHKVPFHILKEIIKKCHKEKLKVIVCVESLREAKKLIYYRPYGIAFEDAKLIGSGKSITDYRSKKVEKFVKILRGEGIKILCGAGISSWKDVEKALELGYDGVLVASAITKAKRPEKFFSKKL